MLKKVSIQTAGSGEAVREGFVVTPETTAQELLTRAKLTGYELCPSANELPFGQGEQLYDMVGDGSVLFAYRKAVAGDKTPASANAGTLLQRRGWVKNGRWCFGYYRTRFGSFEGKIRIRTLHAGDFFLRNPPDALKRHSHWPCFAEKGNGWFSLHFNKMPKSIEDGIKTIERLLVSAFHQANGDGG